MKAYRAHNIGFGLPDSRFFKITLISNNGPSTRFKIAADFESDARRLATDLGNEFLSQNNGLKQVIARECGQFEAV